MRQFLAVFLISALVFTASAEFNLKALADLFNGFTTSMNYTELTPTFDNCSTSVSNTKKFANDVVIATEQEIPDAFAAALSNFGFSFAATIRNCGKSGRLVKTLADTISADIASISFENIGAKIMTNLVQFTTILQSFKVNFQSGNFYGTGENLAQILKLLISDATVFRRQLSGLDDFVSMVGGSPRLSADIFGALLGVQGFLEEANTTIVVDHFTGLVNDTTYFLGKFPELQDAIKSENFSAIVSIVTDLYKYLGVVAYDIGQVKAETNEFIQRDLPLFNNEEKITKAVESLFTDLPTTLTNVMRITNAMKKADYREAGHGSGGVYNQLRKGAQL